MAIVIQLCNIPKPTDLNIMVFHLSQRKKSAQTDTHRFGKPAICLRHSSLSPLKNKYRKNRVQNSKYIKAEIQCANYICGHNSLLIFTLELNKFIQAVTNRIVTGTFASEMHCGKSNLRMSSLQVEWIKQESWRSSAKQSRFLLANTPITQQKQKETDRNVNPTLILSHRTMNSEKLSPLWTHKERIWEDMSSVLCKSDLWPWNFTIEGIGRKRSIWLQHYSSMWPS